MANVAITKLCRYKLGYSRQPNEFLRETIERLVDEHNLRNNIIVPPMTDEE